MTTLAFVLQSPDVTAAWLAHVASAIALQLARDVAPAWGLVAPQVDGVVHDAIEKVPRGALPIVILPNSDVAGDLGYHDETVEGLHYARVFTHGQSPDEISQTISHEAIEALIDPACNGWIGGPGGVLYALEAADPVEGDSYSIAVGAGSAQVSDFVLPAWFDPVTPKQAATDHLGLLKGPWQIRQTGYALVLGSDGQAHTVPAGAGRAAAKAHPAARTARRRRMFG